MMLVHSSKNLKKLFMAKVKFLNQREWLVRKLKFSTSW